MMQCKWVEKIRYPSRRLIMLQKNKNAA